MKPAMQEEYRLEIQFGTRTVKVEVLDIQDTTKKEEAKELFKYL